MKILIVAVYFPPQNSIASLRPYSWAKYWSRWGHDVTVLTTPKPHHPANLLVDCNGFQVVEIPVPFIQKIKSIVQRLDSRKSFDAQRQKLKTPSTLIRLFDKVKNENGALNLCRMPDFHDLWALRTLPVVSQKQWDVVVSTGWPYSTHIVGFVLKQLRLASVWVVDWRDLWTDNHIYRGLPVFRSLEKFLEKLFHKKADIITTISEPLAKHLRQKAGSKVSVIFNGFDQEDYSNLPETPFFEIDKTFRIVYTGSIHPGKRDPTPLFKAIKVLESQHGLTPDQLRVIFAGYNSNMSLAAREAGIERYIEYAGFVQRHEALRMQRDADALLFLEHESHNVEGILTGKLFEYLVAGPPILAVGISNLSCAGKLIETSGRGYACGVDIQLLADILWNMITGNTDFKKTNDLNQFTQFSRSEQAKRMLQIIESLKSDIITK